ncbi:MAG TPA: apolipoprotein N-acyltransferase [Mycobacteriales bacterium]|nr:apolipoprotein N-acyltransferase [Mycobacteriales bacterium]
MTTPGPTTRPAAADTTEHGNEPAPTSTPTPAPPTPVRPTPVLPGRGVATLTAVATGVALVFAFPPFGIWPLAVLGPAALTLVTRGRTARRAAWLGFALGLAFFLPLLHWSGVYVGKAPWIILAVCQAAFLAPLGAATAAVQRLPGWPVWAAALWVAEESVRDRIPFGGFPWGRLAFSQPDGPFTPFAAIGGAPLVTFAVALTGCLLARAATRRSARPDLLPRLLATTAAVAVAAAGLALRPTLPTTATHTQVAAIIQGNVPRLGLDFNAQREQVLLNHVRRTLDLATRVHAGKAPQPAVVIWPENSSDIDPLDNPDAHQQIDHAAQAIGAPILIGAILDGPGPDKRRNAGIVWDPVTGPGATYIKRHPVPFGEYIPLRSLARKVTDKVDLVPQDMVAGHTPGALRIGPITVGDVICFEVAYDGIVRDAVTHGGGIIVVQTNNATFGRTAETYQQLAMSRLRAVEHGRTVLVAATSGISAVIAPDGSLRWTTGILTPAVYDHAVAIRKGRTLATRLGALPEWLLTAAACGALLQLLLTAATTRRRTSARRKENQPT